MSEPLPIAVVCTPGLEFVTRRELAALGVTVPDAPPQPGLIECEAPSDHIPLLNLHLRTASRVLLRAGAFNAAAFSELRKKTARLPWGYWLRPGQPVGIRVSSHASRLYHKKGIAERVAGAVSDALGTESPLVTAADEDAVGGDVQWVYVRLVKDFCRISIDTSGDHLHRRGYRLETAKAPIRETLAAAMILASGWPGDRPFLDPFCGSGTLPIEAALFAAGIPPGLNRRFAFEQWPGFDAAAWEAMRREPRERRGRAMPVILGADRDAGAIRAAAANAGRAGVEALVRWEVRGISDTVAPADGPGWIVTNPPYGARIKGGPDLRNLYARMGSVWRSLGPLWHTHLLSASPRWEAQMGVKTEMVARFNNGGIPVQFKKVVLGA